MDGEQVLFASGKEPPLAFPDSIEHLIGEVAHLVGPGEIALADRGIHLGGYQPSIGISAYRAAGIDRIGGPHRIFRLEHVPEIGPLESKAQNRIFVGAAFRRAVILDGNNLPIAHQVRISDKERTGIDVPLAVDQAAGFVHEGLGAGSVEGIHATGAAAGNDGERKQRGEDLLHRLRLAPFARCGLSGRTLLRHGCAFGCRGSARPLRGRLAGNLPRRQVRRRRGLVLQGGRFCLIIGPDAAFGGKPHGAFALGKPARQSIGFASGPDAGLQNARRHERVDEGILVRIVLTVQRLQRVQLQFHARGKVGRLQIRRDHVDALRDGEVDFATAILRRNRIGGDERDDAPGAHKRLCDEFGPLAAHFDALIVPNGHVPALQAVQHGHDLIAIAMRVADEGIGTFFGHGCNPPGNTPDTRQDYRTMGKCERKALMSAREWAKKGSNAPE